MQVSKKRWNTSLEIEGPLPYRHIKHDVENVVSTQQNIPIVRYQLVILRLSGSFQENIHVTIALDHLAFVLAAILQHNRNSSVQLLHKNVQRLLARLH